MTQDELYNSLMDAVFTEQEWEEIELNAQQYDREGELEIEAHREALENPIPKSTHWHDLYVLFENEERETIKHHQEWISVLISLKEIEPFGTPIYQMCGVYLEEHRIYLQKAVRTLAELRGTHERLS